MATTEEVDASEEGGEASTSGARGGVRGARGGLRGARGGVKRVTFVAEKSQYKEARDRNIEERQEMFRQLDIRGDLANLEELPDIEHQPLARFNLTQKKTNEEKPNKKTLKAKTKTVPVKRTNEDFINNEYNGEEPEEEVI